MEILLVVFGVVLAMGAGIVWGQRMPVSAAKKEGKDASSQTAEDLRMLTQKMASVYDELNALKHENESLKRELERLHKTST